MISLSTGAYYERSNRQMDSLRARAEDLQTQINTEQRLTRSSDDPIAAARMRTLDRGERLTQVDTRSSQRAQTDLNLTDAALTSSADLVIRAKELALRGTSPLLSDGQRDALALEIEGLRDSLFAIANSRDAGGSALFGGQSPGAAYEKVGDGAVYRGTQQRDPVEIGEGQRVVSGLPGPDVFTVDRDGESTDIFTQLSALATALRSGADTAAGASQAALATLDSGLDRITTAQTMVGSRLNWIELMDDRRVSEGERIANEKATTGGADIALTMSQLKETMTVLEATQAGFVRLSGLSLFSMLR